LSFFIGLLDRYLFDKDLLSTLPKGKYALWPITIIIYLIFDRFTWNKSKVLDYVGELEEGDYLKNRVWQFWIVTIIGIMLAASVGYYKKWHLLP
jgi:hypothetical protein